MTHFVHISNVTSDMYIFIYLGNCWFLAAIGALTFEKDIIKQVMPAEQSFTKDYAGIFHFRVTIIADRYFNIY